MKKNMIFIVAVILVTLSVGIRTYAQEIDTFIDSRDEHVYKTVKIGEQWWMAENLAYLPEVCKGFRNCGYYVYGYHGKKVEEAKATDNYAHNGVLYRYKVVQNACPDGWELPSKEDFEILVDNFDEKGEAYTELLENGSSGFSANFSGVRDGVFFLPYKYKKSIVLFFTSTQHRNKFAYILRVSSMTKTASVSNTKQVLGLSVRCIKK